MATCPAVYRSLQPLFCPGARRGAAIAYLVAGPVAVRNDFLDHTAPHPPDRNASRRVSVWKSFMLRDSARPLQGRCGETRKNLAICRFWPSPRYWSWFRLNDSPERTIPRETLDCWRSTSKKSPRSSFEPTACCLPAAQVCARPGEARCRRSIG